MSGRRKTPLTHLVIRPAQPADIDALLAIENAAFPTDRIERRAFRHAIRSPTIVCLVATSDEQVLGYGVVEQRRRSTAARLTSIAIMPKVAGEGLGRRLLASLEAAAAAGGAERMRLEVRADNSVARQLYSRAGYRVVDSLGDYYEDGGAAHRYEKALTAS